MPPVSQVISGAPVRFSRLHTLELPKAYQLFTWVDIHTRAVHFNRRLGKYFPSWKVLPDGSRRPLVNKERRRVAKRVLNPRRRFEVEHVRSGAVLVVPRAFGNTKRRFVDWLLCKAVAEAVARLRAYNWAHPNFLSAWRGLRESTTVVGGLSTGLRRKLKRRWRAGGSAPGPRRVVNRLPKVSWLARLTSVFSATSARRSASFWELSPLLESGAVDHYGSEIWSSSVTRFIGSLAYGLCWWLGAVTLVAAPWFLVVLVLWVLHNMGYY
jgi:hypothetical protein